jgi:hypothetical protein
MQNPKEKEQPTYLYKVFEDTLNLFRNKITSTPVDTLKPQPQQTPTIQHENGTQYSTPLKEEEEVFAVSIEKLKKILPQIKGTKLSYMIERYEELKVLYI